MGQEPTVPLDVPELVERVEWWTEWTTATLAGAPPDAGVPATPVWSVRDVAAHLRAVVDVYDAGTRGQVPPVVDDVRELPALNETLLAPYRGIAVPELAEMVRAAVADLAAHALEPGDPPPRYRFNGGGQVRADRALGLLLGELAVHGHDVAQVTGGAWALGPRDADAVLDGMDEVAPGFVDPDRAGRHTAAYDLRIRGGGRHRWDFRDGRLTAGRGPRPGRVDCTVSGSASDLVLVMYRRRSPWRAAATGGVVVWGRRPWLGPSLPRRFHTP